MLTLGTIVQNRYRIEQLIGKGGMGAVYQATDLRLGNPVALKQTLVTGPKLSAAFEQEARLLAHLRHPALPKVFDHFVDETGQYLVMEFIPGADLGQLLSQRGRPFSLVEVQPWADQILAALDYLHTLQPPIIHRDIKPQNLKLTPQGEIILLDFGLAKGRVAQNLLGEQTITSTLAGYSPQYAPLEQVQHSFSDARSDLYSLGATLYSLLTGTPPPDVLKRTATELNLEPTPLIPVHEINPQVGIAVSEVLNQALALHPNGRFTSAAVMRQALQLACESPTVVLSPSPVPSPAPLPSPKPTPAWKVPLVWPILGGALGLLGLLLLFALLLIFRTHRGRPAGFGPTGTQQPVAVLASKTAPSTKDGGDNLVSYAPENLIDGLKDTAWRVPGSGQNEYVLLKFADLTLINEVKVLPGYAKIDPYTKDDRFPQNRRVKQAQFIFDDDKSVSVSFKDQPTYQSVKLDPPPVSTSLKIEILDTFPPKDSRNPMNFTAISEVVVLGQAKLSDQTR